MAEQVVITTGQTGAEAPAQTEASANRPGWLPEKFQSPEDMAKAYSELEKKLGQGGTKEEKPAAQEQPQAQSEQDKQVEAATEALKVAGLDMTEFSTEFAKDGKLGDESYKKLAEAGFPKEVVDTYIAGLQAANTEAKVLADNTVKEVQQIAGGEAQFKSLLSWAVQNLSKEEQDAYDSMVSTTNVAQAKAAVEWLKAKYEAKEGSEPKLVHGTEKAGEAVFRSAAEVTAAMKDPKYKKDPAYRAEVASKLARSKVF